MTICKLLSLIVFSSAGFLASVSFAQVPSFDIYVVSPAQCVTAFPPQSLRPVSYGFERVEFQPGSYVHLSFNPTQPCEYVCQPGAVFGAAMIQGISGGSFDGFTVTGQWQFREAWVSGSPITQNVKLIRFKCSTMNSSPLRFRYGTTNITVEDCTFRRTGPIPSADVVAVYFSDYVPEKPCTFTIKNCDFAGYSDGIQLGANGLLEVYGDCRVENCDFWVPKEYLIEDGKQMAAGLENAIDVKGRTKKLDIVNCRFEGYRPSVYSGGGGPGYPLTLHDGAFNVTLNRCTWMDCSAGVNVKGTTDRNIKLIDCVADIQDFGAVTPWPEKAGVFITSTGTIHVDGLRYRAKKLEEYPAYQYAPARKLTNVEAY